MDPLTFMRRQAQLLETQLHPDGPIEIGPLKIDYWASFNNGIGLYARPVPGQKLTYGILSSAVKSLLSILDLRVEGSTTHYPLSGGTLPSDLTGKHIPFRYHYIRIPTRSGLIKHRSRV